MYQEKYNIKDVTINKNETLKICNLSSLSKKFHLNIKINKYDLKYNFK